MFKQFQRVSLSEMEKTLVLLLCLSDSGSSLTYLLLVSKSKFTTPLVSCGPLEDQAVNPSAPVDIPQPPHTLSSPAFLQQGHRKADQSILIVPPPHIPAQ